MKLNEIHDNAGSHVKRSRVGRGMGSGKGKTSGHGHKGQNSRSGVSLLGFEGGQMPLYRRLPKRGFNNIFRRNYGVINLGDLQKAIDAGKLDAGKPITEDVLKAAGMLRSNRDGARLLGNGEIKTKVTLEVSGASGSAVSAIEKSGGTITLTAPKKIKSEKKANRGKAAAQKKAKSEKAEKAESESPAQEPADQGGSKDAEEKPSSEDD